MFCKHEWEKITEQVIKSPAESIASLTIESAPMGFFKKKYICILQCKKCGKLNKTILEA